MSTRSIIGYIAEDKTVTATYCHSDGYPEWQVPAIEHFIAENGVQGYVKNIQLAAHVGGISYIGIASKLDLEKFNRTGEAESIVTDARHAFRSGGTRIQDLEESTRDPLVYSREDLNELATNEYNDIEHVYLVDVTTGKIAEYRDKSGHVRPLAWMRKNQKNFTVFSTPKKVTYNNHGQRELFAC